MRAIQRSGQVVLSTEPLAIGFTNQEDGRIEILARTGELIVERGDRVAIVGPNGSGKTTALRTLIGEIPTLKGSISFGTNVKPAYYAQGHEGLDQSRTALDTILRDQPMGEEQARNLLGRFLFSEDDVFKRVSQLSGGERSRLALARLTLERANFLILDEPTNHLDILAREELEDVLGGYDGTLLFVSHDRFFIDRIANRVWAIEACPEPGRENGELVQYLGNYTDMLRKRASRAQPAERRESAPEPKLPEEPVRDAAARGGSRKQLDRDLRNARKRLDAAERAVSQLEARLSDLNDAIGRASADQDVERLAKLGTEYDATRETLEAAYADWSQAGSALDQLLAEAEPVREGQRA
jgi:ATP-binding cassette subfamily F protein 3